MSEDRFNVQADRWKHRLFRTEVKVKTSEDLSPTPWQNYLSLGFRPWSASDILAYMDRMGYHYRLSHGLFEPVDPDNLSPGLMASIDYRRMELTKMVSQEFFDAVEKMRELQRQYFSLRRDDPNKNALMYQSRQAELKVDRIVAKIKSEVQSGQEVLF